MKQHIRRGSVEERAKGVGQELNREVIQGMEKLEERYRKSEDELNRLNQDLRKQLIDS